MATVYKFPDGTLSADPIGREAAIALKSATYAQVEKCTEPTMVNGEQCGCRYRHTESGKCVVCARREAPEFRAYVLGLLEIKEGPVVEWMIDGYNTNRPISQETADLYESTALMFEGATPAMDRAGAVDSVLGVYLDYTPCKKSGHLGVYYPDGKCFFCEKEKAAKSMRLSPRAEAIRDGRVWYTPNEPCKRCGTTSERNVNNGSCKGCM